MLSLVALLLAAGAPAEPVVPTDLAPATIASPNAPDVILQMVIADIRAGQNADALNLLNPVADAASAKMKSASNTTYCAHSSTEGLLYLSRARQANGKVEILGPTPCETIFLRAYVLENLDRLPEAIEQLRQLILREPEFPHYQVEYASALRQSGDMDAALDGYRRVVEMAAPGKQYPLDQAAALRGIGFILTERGNLDGAEQAYHQSLDLAPGHPLALRELAYIAHLRATGLRAPAKTFESSTKPADAHLPDQQQHR